mmetsp:Transcript_24552/g.57679  ORF Transcript_24552/g.57679 Transcript_24552/m.57679 type:complete len:201 (-) Transcript_24552:592-1194(-)
MTVTGRIRTYAMAVSIAAVTFLPDHPSQVLPDLLRDDSAPGNIPRGEALGRVSSQHKDAVLIVAVRGGGGRSDRNQNRHLRVARQVGQLRPSRERLQGRQVGLLRVAGSPDALQDRRLLRNRSRRGRGRDDARPAPDRPPVVHVGEEDRRLGGRRRQQRLQRPRHRSSARVGRFRFRQRGSLQDHRFRQGRRDVQLRDPV